MNYMGLKATADRHVYLPFIWYTIDDSLRSSCSWNPATMWFLSCLLFCSCSSFGTESLRSPRQVFEPMKLGRQARFTATSTFCVPLSVHSLSESYQAYPCLGHLMSLVPAASSKQAGRVATAWLPCSACQMQHASLALATDPRRQWHTR